MTTLPRHATRGPSRSDTMARLTFRSFWSFMRRAGSRQHPVQARRRHFERVPLRLGVLEDRTLPSVSVSIVGSVVTFTGDGADDNLLLHRNNAGQLEYSVNDGASFTSTQALTASPATRARPRAGHASSPSHTT